jgi:hypothetical protein
LFLYISFEEANIAANVQFKDSSPYQNIIEMKNNAAISTGRIGLSSLYLPDLSSYLNIPKLTLSY